MRWVWLVCVVVLVATGAHAHRGVPAELSALSARIRANPTDADLRLDRARLQRRRGHHAEALADLRVAAKLRPDHWALLLERGLVRRALGRVKAAEADLTASIEAHATAEALTARAELYERRNQLDRARADYDRAIRLGPTPERYLARGRIDEARGELDRAARGYAQGLAKLGGALVLRLALVRVERARGRYEHALQLVDELLAQASFDADWLLLRGDIHAEAKHPAQARRDRERALELLNAAIARRPNALRLASRAKAKLALGDPEGALADAERAHRLAPRLDEVRALLRRVRTRAAKEAK